MGKGTHSKFQGDLFQKLFQVWEVTFLKVSPKAFCVCWRHKLNFLFVLCIAKANLYSVKRHKWSAEKNEGFEGAEIGRAWEDGPLLVFR